MALMRLILLSTLFFSGAVEAGLIPQYFKAKNFNKVIEEFKSNKRMKFSKREFIMISYALRSKRMYREDILLNARFVKYYFPKEHARLLKDLRESNTIDPDEYSKSQKLIYWILFTDYVQILSQVKDKKDVAEKDLKYLQMFSKLLEGLEFREGQVDRLNTKINNHLQYLEDKIYHFEGSLFFNYMTWQRDVSLESSSAKSTLLVTNRGYCLGGDAGVSNYRYHFFMDGCFLIGAGGVSNPNPPPEYEQANVRVLGLKAGPGASIIVSDSRSRLGIKFPFIYNIQRFQNPPPATGFKVEELNPLSYMATLYSRFQFGKWYLQTEFGKYITEERSVWAIGFGKEF